MDGRRQRHWEMEDAGIAMKYAARLAMLPAGAMENPEYQDRSGDVLSIETVMEQIEKKPVPPQGVQTYNKQVLAVSGFMKWTVKKYPKLMQVNHFDELAQKDNRAADELKRPYTNKELQRLFSAPEFTDAINVERPERFFVPLISVLAGPRLNEACSLYAEDVKEVEGIWYLDFNRNSADKHIKNDGSVRKVPIHPWLISAGLVDYALMMKEKGSGTRLWPKLNLQESNGYGGALGHWWGRFRKEHIEEAQWPFVDFHSLRRSLINELKQKLVMPTIVEEIDGHKHVDNAMSMSLYPDPYYLKTLYDALMKLEYKGVDFSGIKAPV